MPTFRYDTSGLWLKGNIHTHSTASDGGRTPEELESMYGNAGYDFLCRSDHWVASQHEPRNSGFLWLNGIELDGQDHTGAFYHVVALGSFTGLEPHMGLEAGLQAVRAQGGLTILAHPFWTGNTVEDALRWPFDGIELYNHVCHWLNGKDDGLIHWNATLARRPFTLGFAVDDTHASMEHPVWNGGWIHVNVRQRTSQAVLDAIRTGNFYSSCGPSFLTIEETDNKVRIVTSPVRFVRMVGPGWHGQRRGRPDGEPVTESIFDLPADWPYVYVEIEDADGRRAWTNPLMRE